MNTFSYRTEELSLEEIENYYVESKEDRNIINYLKSPTPVVLVGSRGVGKSFLFKLAESELLDSQLEDKIIPVYLTFRASSLIHTSNTLQFQSWMLSRICSELFRALNKQGRIVGITRSLAKLTGDTVQSSYEESKIERIAKAFENSWKNPEKTIDVNEIPSVDEFLDSIEDLCEQLEIKRIVLFIDEAAHVFIPEQQREFFTLFRDLRSPYLKCNAAVYPGVTSYGDSFQPMHDAYFMTMNRDVTSDEYITQMKDIVLKQVTDSKLAKNISTRGQNFALLAYASDGNPRHLLKTVAIAESMNSNDVNKVFREYYKAEIWSEHTSLGEKYKGHRGLVDGGRDFVESIVLPELKRKNDKYLEEGKNTSAFIWINRSAPQQVKESLRLLEYTGIISGHTDGIKATRSEYGSRYHINLGCLISQEATPTSTGFNIVKELTLKRMTEYGANHSAFQSILEKTGEYVEENLSVSLIQQLEQDVNVLDLTEWQISKLVELNLLTVGAVLTATEGKLMEAHYIAEKRARIMKNAALAAVYEYISG